MVRKIVRALALPLLVAAPLAATQGCTSDITDIQKGLCCSDFKVGADLSSVKWGLDGQGELDFEAFMQATADFSGVASATLNDVTAACKGIAVDLGEPDVETITDPSARAEDWCTKASGHITATFSGGVSISFQPPSCTVEASVQGNCEAKCSANASCKIDDAAITARCDPGQLEVKCGGSCMGSCEGSANVAVQCKGTCSGTCDGTCMGGTMDGKTGVACDGTCSGGCRGSCSATADASGHCEGSCKGGCSAMASAPKCDVDLKPPAASCQGSANCSGSCQASASAKAECKPPSVSIKASANVDVSAVTSLQTHLPQLIIAIKVRGATLAANAQVLASASVSLGGTVTANPTASATLCLIPAAEAITDAVANAGGIVSASAKISGSIGL